MNWFLWREFRRNQWILLKGVIVIPLPHIIVSLINWPPTDRDSAFFHA